MITALPNLQNAALPGIEMIQLQLIICVTKNMLA